MAKLEIKVGASVDRGLAVAFRPLVEGAKRAAASVEAEQKKAARAIERDAKKAAAEEARAYQKAAKEIERWQREAARTSAQQKREEVRAFESAEREKSRLVEREAKARARAEAATMRDQQRLALANAREMERHMRSAAAAERRKDAYVGGLASRGVRGALGIGRAAAGAAMGIAGGLARSQGVNLDMSTIFAQNAALETMATQLSASAYMPGAAGRNGMRSDPRELMREALGIGASTGTDANEVMAGLQKFVSLTGDLSTGRDVMQDLLKLSKATGTEFGDMAAAAGNVAANLPDTADKAARVKDVMRAVAGQGKLGAVEIKDLATQMARLASSAGQFEGDSAKTIETLGVMTQMSRAKGGSKGAPEAAGSISSFVGMLKTKRRAEEFEKATGVKVYNEKSGMLRDPMTIIKEALRAKGMNPLAFQTIFANMQGGRAAAGWATIYRQAGGGDAGIKAVDDEFERLKRATMSLAEVEESFKRAMATGPSQAEQFNQAMRQSALQMQEALLPAVVALAPAVVEATKTVAKLTTDLLGPDKGATTLAANEGKAHSLLESAATQVRGGNISAATRDQLAAQEPDLKAAMELAQKDAGTAKQGQPGWLARTAIQSFDYSLPGNIMSLIGGGSVGHGVGEAYLKNQDVNVQKKQWQADDSKRLYEEVVTANKLLRDEIAKGLKVHVTNPNEIGNKGDGPPGLGGGRTPSPEERAEER